MDYIRVYKFKFDIEPKAKGRPRFSRGRTYTPGSTIKAEAEIRRQARSQFFFSPLTSAVGIRANFQFTKAKSNKSKYMVKRPDIDNVLKLFGDALNGVVWKDDSQIIKCEVVKTYGSKGLIEMEVFEYE